MHMSSAPLNVEKGVIGLGTLCTCFTRTRVQILTQKRAGSRGYVVQQVRVALGAHERPPHAPLGAVERGELLQPSAPSVCGLKLLVYEALSY
jgi:hypothetical protein